MSNPLTVAWRKIAERRSRKWLAGLSAFSLLAAARGLRTLPALRGSAAPEVHSPGPWAPGSAPDLLVVGGGPDLQHNQVAIESNVRYVLNLFRRAESRTSLFADGHVRSPTVLYEQSPAEHSFADFTLGLILTRQDPGDLVRRSEFRPPQLPRLDGPSSRKTIQTAFSTLADKGHARPLVLYFTGHGSQGEDQDFSDNSYALWNDKDYTVGDLAQQLARLPTGKPVVLVMAQCFSGAFARLIFRGGRSREPMIPQDLAGFFGATADRVAAGCTPDVHESSYQDFTTYFMAALSGQDRLGGTVSGADYNHDGRVGMDEAFCYALIHDPTVDVPVCTSDAFLRDRAPGVEVRTFRTPLTAIRAWGTPAQAAALDALAAAVLRDEATRQEHAAARSSGQAVDLSAVYARLSDSATWRGTVSLMRYRVAHGSLLQLVRAERRILYRRLPGLRSGHGPASFRARARALRLLASTDLARATAIRAAYGRLQNIDARMDENDLQEARELRLLRLARTVSLTHDVIEHGTPKDRRDLRRVLTAEQRPLFP